ncbi:MAG: nucleoside triphosphate pyrophosphatase [Granulosicoccus sp.]
MRNKTLVLASQSVRRLELLRQLGLQPVCQPVDVDEEMLEVESAQALVARLAKLKARTGAQQLFTTQGFNADNPCVILGADTVVELDGVILGKPTGEAHALNMLRSLSGREHNVHSGVCILDADTQEEHAAVVTTGVRFTAISAQTALRYWHTGEPADKAGSYAIQGIGAQFVVHVTGSYSNVVGLPLFETSELLTLAGITLF